MKVISQKELNKHEITNFKSSNSFASSLLKGFSECQITFMELKSNGVIGLHQAVSDQIFIVLEGRGIISDKLNQQVEITNGDCIFWQKGEWHQTTSIQGLQAIIIEGKDLFSKI